MGGTVRTRAWCDGALVAENFSVDEISDHLANADTIVWADIDHDDTDGFSRLADELGLHELAVEDAIEEAQRPKVDFYRHHLFLSCHAAALEPATGRLEIAEVDAFVGDRWILTVRVDGLYDVERLIERWDRFESLTRYGPAALLYSLLDDVVDGYFEVLDRFSDYYDDVSESLFSEHATTPTQSRQWFDMRRALVHFHRTAAPMREVVSSLMRRDHSYVPDELFPYYQDVYDHTLRSADTADSLRGLVSTIVETDLAMRDYQQNQVMKKVGSWAAIFAVPAFITGWFGMNVPFPGAESESGLWLASGLVVAAVVGLWASFKHNDWL